MAVPSRLSLALLALCMATALGEQQQQRRGAGARGGFLGIKGKQLLKDHPWYHSTEDIRDEAVHLSKACKGAEATVRMVHEDSLQVEVVRVRGRGATPVNRVFILFGEHARELISPESGLYFLRMLCGDTTEAEAKLAAETLKDSEFEMVLNGNPTSRVKVEDGDYCLRTNKDGVDLNRNWDNHWRAMPEGRLAEVNPGPRPFSEPETRAFRRLVSEFKPTTFMSIHSGVFGTYMPWAYSTSRTAERNGAEMLEVLKVVNEEHCRCPYGPVAQTIGYNSPGASVDYAYGALNTSYAFLFEIYEMRTTLPWLEPSPAPGSSLLSFRPPEDVLLQVEHPNDDAVLTVLQNTCFQDFNPHTRELYDETVRNWGYAYLQVANMVTGYLRKAV